MVQLSILWAGYYYTHLGYRKMGLKELPRVILSADGLGSEVVGTDSSGNKDVWICTEMTRATLPPTYRKV